MTSIRKRQAMSFQVEVKLVIVSVDIKPDSHPNSINLGSNRQTPVAIRTTADFDATTIDTATVRFGPKQAEPVHYAIEDADYDDDDDISLHFITQELGLDPDDVEATLTGQNKEPRGNATGKDKNN